MLHSEKMPQWRRDEIKERVLHILERAKIDGLPVSLRSILLAFGWRVTSVKKAREAGMQIEDSDDGFSVVRSSSSGDVYLIIYNDSHSHGRIRWTIAHEIGHIALGHLKGREPVTDAEAEANYFARELLTPLAVLDELGARSAEDIASLCDISMEAAKIRAGDFVRRDGYKARHGNTEYDMRFLRQFAAMFRTEFAEEFYIEVARAA